MVYLLPDPAELRAFAGRVDTAASAARIRADRLGSAVAGAGWRGPAARAFTSQAEIALGALRTAAGRLDDVADAARRHAARVDVVVQALTNLVRAGVATVPQLLALPGDVLQSLDGGVTDVLTTAGGLASTVGDVADSALDCVGLG